MAALGLRCCARASHCGGFSCCGARDLSTRASVVVVHCSCGSRAVEHRLSRCGKTCGIFPDQGSNPCLIGRRILFCFFLKHLYWSIIASQWCVSFCFITKWIIYTYTYVPISFPSCVSLPPALPIPPLQAVTKHREDLPVLCGCFPLASYFMFGSVCMSMPLSHFVPAYPSPSPYPQVHSLVGLCLYSHLAPRFFMTIFFF